jgi:tetratricopeptide (TPR) repeat protein
MARRRIAVAALALLCALDCAAAPRWLKLNSANFELLTTADEQQGRAAILYFEEVRGFFLSSMQLTAASALPVRIIAFSSPKEFALYRPNQAAAAYAAGGRDRDYIVLQGSGPEYFPVAVHEYVHLLLRPSAEKLPVWLNEGLAELYSTLKPVGRKVRVGDIIPGHLRVLRDSAWLDLETLTSVGRDSPHYNERNRATVFYAEAWALTHMLLLSDKYRPKFPQFLAAAMKGDQNAAFEQIYGKKMPEVWTDLQSYLRKSGFKILLFNLQLEKAAEQPEMREATPLESGLALAGLLGAIHKWDDARRAFEELVRQNPASAEVEEAFGYVEWLAGGLDRASRHFARAAELGSRNPKLYFDYAALLHQRGERAAALIPLLSRAVELDPGFMKAHFLLGIGLVEEKRYQEAIAHFAQVKRADREEAYPLFSAAAFAYYRLGKRKEALEAAESARKYARGDLQVDAAEKMLDFLKEVWIPPAVEPAPPPAGQSNERHGVQVGP